MKKFDLTKRPKATQDKIKKLRKALKKLKNKKVDTTNIKCYNVITTPTLSQESKLPHRRK